MTSFHLSFKARTGEEVQRQAFELKTPLNSRVTSGSSSIRLWLSVPTSNYHFSEHLKLLIFFQMIKISYLVSFHA